MRVSPDGGRCRFGYHSRLHGTRAFDAVYRTRYRKNLGPITVCFKRNDLRRYRLGLSVPRRVGSAVRRNRIKRLIREAFRTTRRDGGDGCDMIVIVRPHEPVCLSDYQRMMKEAMMWGHRRLRKISTRE